jgi:hypothetical protein
MAVHSKKLTTKIIEMVTHPRSKSLKDRNLIFKEFKFENRIKAEIKLDPARLQTSYLSNKRKEKYPNQVRLKYF